MVLRKTVYAKSKGADQPKHACSLIRAIVFHCLKRIMNMLTALLASLRGVTEGAAGGISS